jgi:hypothetical protein
MCGWLCGRLDGGRAGGVGPTAALACSKRAWGRVRRGEDVGLTAAAVVARSYRNSESPRAAMAMVGVLNVRSLAQSEEGEGELLGWWRGE